NFVEALTGLASTTVEWYQDRGAPVAGQQLCGTRNLLALPLTRLRLLVRRFQDAKKKCVNGSDRPWSHAQRLDHTRRLCDLHRWCPRRLVPSVYCLPDPREESACYWAGRPSSWQ